MNASAVPAEIQQEAARSLLERLREKTALVRWFRFNASAKHGLPLEPDREIVFNTPVEKESPPPADVPVQPVTTPPQTFVYHAGARVAEGASNGSLKAILATLAILGLGVTTGVVGWALGYRGTQPQTEVESRQMLQSPYQFLEDMGAHWYE